MSREEGKMLVSGVTVKLVKYELSTLFPTHVGQPPVIASLLVTCYSGRAVVTSVSVVSVVEGYGYFFPSFGGIIVVC